VKISGTYSSSELEDSYFGADCRDFFRFGVSAGGTEFSSLSSASGLAALFFFFVHFRAA
jgi:hypothetical protein